MGRESRNKDLRSHIQDKLDSFDMKDRTSVDNFIRQNHLRDRLDHAPATERILRRDYERKQRIFPAKR